MDFADNLDNFEEINMNNPEAYVLGEYLDEDGDNVRDFNIDSIHTGDWKKFRWVEFMNTDNIYARIDSYMFSINQYSNNNHTERFHAIIKSMYELDALVNAYDDLQDPFYFVYRCRYFRFLRWIIQTPHFYFLKDKLFITEFCEQVYKNYSVAIWLDENLAEGNIYVNNPYEEYWGEAICVAECINEITNFIEVIQNIQKIQNWVNKKIYKRRIIQQVVSFNHLKNHINLDCLQSILVKL
jgi:hypothetical protein